MTAELVAEPKCTNGLQKSAWVLARHDLRHYLQWVAARFDRGFPQDEQSKMCEAAANLRIGKKREFTFMVQHDRRRVALHVTLMLWDETNLMVQFCTRPDLAEAIDLTTESYFVELAL
jgi:hypothetical protein